MSVDWMHMKGHINKWYMQNCDPATIPELKNVLHPEHPLDTPLHACVPYPMEFFDVPWHIWDGMDSLDMCTYCMCTLQNPMGFFKVTQYIWDGGWTAWTRKHACVPYSIHSIHLGWDEQLEHVYVYVHVYIIESRGIL